MKTFEITIDAKTPSRLARFWADVLSGYEIRAYAEAEVARLAENGFTPETDPSVAIDGPGPTIWFQQSDSMVEERNRKHLDVKSSDAFNDKVRFEQLGARVKLQRTDHIVMLDPEGNQFFLFDTSILPTP